VIAAVGDAVVGIQLFEHTERKKDVQVVRTWGIRSFESRSPKRISRGRVKSCPVGALAGVRGDQCPVGFKSGYQGSSQDPGHQAGFMGAWQWSGKEEQGLRKSGSKRH
jgi:hypothetical protein